MRWFRRPIIFRGAKRSNSSSTFLSEWLEKKTQFFEPKNFRVFIYLFFLFIYLFIYFAVQTVHLKITPNFSERFGAKILLKIRGFFFFCVSE